MARKVAAPPPDPPVSLTMPREDAARRIAERIDKGAALRTKPVDSLEDVNELTKAYDTWTEYNEEMLHRMFTSPKVKDEYSSGWFAIPFDDLSPSETIEQVHGWVDTRIRRLTSIRERLELIPLAPGLSASSPTSVQVGSSARATVATQRVFVVHGRDEATKESVARFIAKLDLTPIILHEQPSQGRTLVEKLERHGDVGYAVMLLTPDDVGGDNQAHVRPRARQNVVLELGYFVGRLGRERVCALHKGDLELPSDYVGVVYVPLDDAGGWRLALAKEFRAAGLPIDMNRAL